MSRRARRTLLIYLDPSPKLDLSHCSSSIGDPIVRIDDDSAIIICRSISAVTQILEFFEEKSLTNNAHLAKPRLDSVCFMFAGP